MRTKEEAIELLKKRMYGLYGFKGGTLLTKEHNMIKWLEDDLGSELLNKTYDEYYQWLEENKSHEEIRLEKEIESLKSMMESCFTYGGLDKNNRYIKPYVYKLGIELFDKVYTEQSKNLRENYFVIKNVHTDHEGCTYNSLTKIN